jgi:hypothetical protein
LLRKGARSCNPLRQSADAHPDLIGNSYASGSCSARDRVPAQIAAK